MISVDTCLACPHSEISDGIELDKWEGWVCRKKHNKICALNVGWVAIPNWCPLDTSPERTIGEIDEETR